jgi:mannose-6-phosphate isomerase-like protein (cupin superfamily)
MLPPVPIHNTRPKTYSFLGVQMTILLSGEETGDQFSMIEGIMPPGGDGGLHMHAHEDESMHLLDGALEVTIGETVFTLAPGETYFAPRGIPHRLRNLGTIPARTLLVATPGAFDRFISRAGVPVIDGVVPPAVPLTAEQIGRLLTLAAEFGITILAPPGP